MITSTLGAQHFRKKPEPALFASESDGIEGEERHFTAEMPVRKVETETHKGGEPRGSAASYCRLSHVPSCRSQYALLAFGAKIGRREGSAPVEQMVITEPIVGNGAVVVHPAQNGGTRHLSAAQFVHDQRDTLALVASQDGRFTIFVWSAGEAMVHAHQVETLLL
jgi:hypothetical protein